MPRKAIIIGAGPAGLTAAYELLKRTDIIPVILEKSGEIGGISRTIDYKGNRMDMGPHRFFSKSDRVMDWWLNIMPLKGGDEQAVKISYQNKSVEINGSAAAAKDSDKVMLVIQRLTRIYFLRKFFSYPIQLSIDTLKTLGLIRTIKILVSFLWIRLFPQKPEKSLEDFIVNKFGRQLYLLFFKDYTEKVWGIAPSQISAEWGAQRIKGVSLSKAIAAAIKSLGMKKKGDIAQKGTETSLIDQFLYPKYGPGSLWEEVARQVQEMGGQLYLHQEVKKIHLQEDKVCSVNTLNSETGQAGAWEGDYFFSTMPVQELIAGMGEEVPVDVQQVAAGLLYRDFINVGVLLNRLSTTDGRKLELKDNWIYIQERDVKVGRLMIYNNWGGGMVRDPNTTWIGMEYFCNKADDFWTLGDETVQSMAVKELEKMDLARTEDVLDITVQRMEKTYPAYFGTYDQFDKIRAFTDQYDNLFLIGRNGMHKYNNADHSMLCAMVAVDNIASGITAKANLWAINTEQEYHEEKQPESQEIEKAQKATAGRLIVEDFGDYLLKDKLNRTFLWIAGIALITQFIVFKFLYPYAGFIDGDSYVYIRSATYNWDINMYPIGYSKFLRLFSIFTKSDTALVAFQYFSIQTCALWFIFTLFKLYSPGKLTKWLIFSLVVFNPVFLYISNYVTSDSIFLALSLAWFTILLWTLKAPNIRLAIAQCLILLIAFMMRYNALYYPLIAAVAYLLSDQSMRRKVVGIGTSLLVISLFISYTSNQFYHLTGVRQFTPFSGWQIANNALYAYRNVESRDWAKMPSRFQQLDNQVRHHFEITRNLRARPQTTFYMWAPASPLNIYMEDVYKEDSSDMWLRRWASMAPLYSEYGTYLIKSYPMTYLKYFLLPNAIDYYTPPVEFLKQYNMGKATVAPIGQEWFEYKSNKVYTAFKDFNVNAVSFMSILAGIMNVAFLFGFVSIYMLKGFRDKLLQKIIFLAAALWVINFGFSVVASPVTLRYQLFAILVFSSFALLFIDHIFKVAYTKQTV